MAVDWISEKLVDRGVSVLRIGNPTKVNDKMLSFTYERLFADHPDYPQLWSIRKAIRQLRQTPRTKRTRDHHDKMDRLQSRATQLEITIHQQLFSQARVVACTLAGSASRVMQGQKFTTLFIDEAAQALEAACWIAMRRASRVVLAGDHCQLPPTVKSLEAQRGGLGVTLMERLVAKKPEAVTLLRMQYRMNRDIMQFSSDWFYHGRMVADGSVSHRSIMDLDRPMQWIDTSADEGHEETLPGDMGRINRHEARHTIEVLKACYQKITPQRAKDEGIDTGLISPYRAQVQLLRQMVRRDAFFKPLAHLITINTVDGFQGQERDIIIVSMVRANGDGRIGFLNDLRRMNVAITRARMKLVIMGNAQTLTRHAFYRKLFEYCNRSED